jgi:hypothetical protein
MEEFKIEDALKIYERENNISEACRIHCQEIGIEYSEKYRNRLSRYLRSGKFEVDSDLENETFTDTNQYATIATLSALKPDGSIMSIKEYCSFYKIPFEDVRTYKLVTHTGKGAYYNLASNPIKGEGFENFYQNLLKELSEIPNKPKTVVRQRLLSDESYLLVVDAADCHIGKLADSFETGEDYNSQIAVQRVREGVEGIIEKTKGFPIDKILFVGGNDILHIDTPKNTTTAGTHQNTAGMWYSNFLMAKDIYVEVLNRLLEIADIHFVFNPSNHDYFSGFFLADVIKTYYKDCSNITFDCSIAHRKYFTYGQNLIGTAHGDGGKMSDLPLTMAHESKDWSNCKHKYFYVHHYHHKISKDYMGVNVEALRSPSGTDSWHSRNQYHFAPKAIEGFLHSKEHGQIARITHLFSLLVFFGAII